MHHAYVRYVLSCQAVYTHCFRLCSRYPHTPRQTSKLTNALMGMMTSEITGSKYKQGDFEHEEDEGEARGTAVIDSSNVEVEVNVRMGMMVTEISGSKYEWEDFEYKGGCVTAREAIDTAVVGVGVIAGLLRV